MYKGKCVRSVEEERGRKRKEKARCVPVCERNGVQKPKLQDVQLQARLDERRDCQRRQQKALSLLPPPPPRSPPFLRGFLPTLRNGLREPGFSPLFLLSSFNERARGFHVDFTNEIFSFVHK